MKMNFYILSLICVVFLICTRECQANKNHANSTASNKSSTLMLGKIDYTSSAISAAGISLSSLKLPALVTKVRKGSPAYFAAVREGDKIVSADISNNKLFVLLERNRIRFSTSLNTMPVKLAEDPPNETDSILDKNMLKGEAVYNKLADSWLELYDKPDDPRLVAEVNRLQIQVQKRVQSNGGRWYRYQPYLENGRNPKFLLCSGVRFYAVGDLRNAVKLFEEVVSLSHDPETVADALFNLAAICESQKKFTLAAYYYEKAQKTLPFDLEIQKAISTIGKSPVLYEGGAFEPVKRRALTGGVDVCPRCRVVRDKIMNGG